MKPSAIFALCFLTCTGASAQFNYTTNNGTITITGYTGVGGAITLPDTINGLPVTSIGDYAFRLNASLTSMVIPSGVNSIGSSAFWSCFSLTNVTIPSSVFSIGYGAFFDCTSLIAIDVDPLNPAYSSFEGVLFNRNQDMLIQFPGGKAGSYLIPYGVTRIGQSAFMSCASVTSVTMPDSVIKIEESAFFFCVSLTDVMIGNNVTSIGNSAFAWCPNLTHVTIPSSVFSIGDGAFVSCTSLTAIDVDTLNPMYSSFEGVLFNKNQDTLIQFPGGIAGSYVIPNSVINIGRVAFSECSSVTNITVPNSVINIGDFAFSNCASLTRITIPNSVTNIPFFAFAGCSSLTRIEIPASIISIAYGAFDHCARLTAIDVDTLNPVYSSLEGVLFNKNQDTLVQFPGGIAGSYRLPESVAHLTDWAFHGCDNLGRVIIPGSLTVLPLYSFQSPNLSGIYFEGDAPILQYAEDWFGGPLGWDIPAAIVYYREGTTSWGSVFADRPTALWITAPAYEDWLVTTRLPTQYPQASAETDDPDQDHLNNYAEMLAGTDPADPDSVLTLEREPRPSDLTAADQAPIGADQIAVYVRSVPGKTYGVQWAYPPTGPWTIETVATASTAQMRFVFDNTKGRCFYRAVLAQ